MKRVIINIICLYSLSSFAQSISSHVITPFVNEGSSYGLKLQGHLGEVAVQTLDNGVTIITQGFNQPSEVFGLGMKEKYEGLDVFVYPNITNHSIRVDYDTNIEDLKMHLFNRQGQLVFIKNLNHYGQSNIMLSALSEGTYYAVFMSDNYRKKKTVQIIKTNK